MLQHADYDRMNWLYFPAMFIYDLSAKERNKLFKACYQLRTVHMYGIKNTRWNRTTINRVRTRRKQQRIKILKAKS